ncbi:unnamed protein product [Rhizophagus irregularis]|nr:unnamed protein product [Rhizophagus irregularis]CAB5384401.1 unnamed protein product [Rhizophagus irregularis]
MSFNKKHENPHNETNVDNDQDRHDNRFKNIIKDMIKKITYLIIKRTQAIRATILMMILIRKKIIELQFVKMENLPLHLIRHNFTISKFYDKNHKPPSFNQESKLNTSDDDAKEDEKSDAFRWSFDVSNLHKNDDEYYILVTVSRETLTRI